MALHPGASTIPASFAIDLIRSTHLDHMNKQLCSYCGQRAYQLKKCSACKKVRVAHGQGHRVYRAVNSSTLRSQLTGNCRTVCSFPTPICCMHYWLQVSYCSVACQRSDWGTHKQDCLRWRRGAAEPNA